MDIFESIKLAIKQLAGNKGRTILTMMGMFIGVGAVIMILALGNGVTDTVMGEVADAGLGIFYIDVKEDIPENRITPEEVALIREMPSVEYLATYNDSDATFNNNKGDEFSCYITGGQPKLTEEIRNIEIIAGRNLNDKDESASLANIVVPDAMVKAVYGDKKELKDAIGETININIEKQTVSFSIIGIYDSHVGKNLSQKELENVMQSRAYYIPFSTLDGILGLDGKVASIAGSIYDGYDQVTIATQIGQILNRRHHLKDGYSVNTMVTMMEMAQNILSVLTLFISAIASISLLVGGVGIMNIMLVTVKERTKEIGIRKALGAPNKAILGQFLIEALILTLIAGCIGMIIGYIGAFLIAAKMNIRATFTPSIILFSTVTSTAVGIIFGVYPAYQAARLDPVEALRAD